MDPTQQTNGSEIPDLSEQSQQTQTAPTPEPPAYENPSTVAPSRAVRNLVEGTTRSKLYTLAAALCIIGVYGYQVFGKSNNQVLATICVLLAVAGFLLGLFVMVKSTAREQGHSTGGQIGHIFKVILIAGAVLLAISIALVFIAMATGNYHP